MKKVTTLILSAVLFSFVTPTCFAQNIMDLKNPPQNETLSGTGKLEEIAKKIQAALETLVSDYYGVDLKTKERPTTPTDELDAITNASQLIYTLTSFAEQQQWQKSVNESLANPVLNSAPLAQSLTQQAINNQLTYNSACDKDITQSCRSALLVSDYMYKNSGLSDLYNPNTKQDPKNNQMLNFNAFIAPLRYPSISTGNGTGSDSYGGQKFGANAKTGDHAYNFINTLSGVANPVPTKTITEFHGGKNVKYRQLRYVMNLRQYTALLSVGLSNFYHILAQRMPQEGLGAKAGIPDTDNASQLEVEHYTARRRLTKKWHDEMEKASPLTIQREQLYTLAEMNYQLYQLRQENQRILSTLSALQLENLQVFYRGNLESGAAISGWK